MKIFTVNIIENIHLEKDYQGNGKTVGSKSFNMRKNKTGIFQVFDMIMEQNEWRHALSSYYGL